jgi:hypothetical protein
MGPFLYQQASICLHVIDLLGEELKSAAIITAELNRFRIRTFERQGK